LAEHDAAANEVGIIRNAEFVFLEACELAALKHFIEQAVGSCNFFSADLEDGENLFAPHGHVIFSA